MVNNEENRDSNFIEPDFDKAVELDPSDSRYKEVEAAMLNMEIQSTIDRLTMLLARASEGELSIKRSWYELYANRFVMLEYELFGAYEKQLNREKEKLEND